MKTYQKALIGAGAAAAGVEGVFRMMFCGMPQDYSSKKEFHIEDLPTPAQSVVKNLVKRQDKLGMLARMELTFMEMDGAPYKQAKRKWDAIPHEEYRIVNPDWQTLHGIFFPSETDSDVFVLLSHGYNMNATQEWTRYVPIYHKMGYNVLAIDHVAEGESEGRYITFGEQESRDAVFWLNYFNDKFGKDNIQFFLHGCSMCASTVLLMTGDAQLPDNVKFIIEDSGYTSAKEEFDYILDAFHIPKAIADPLVKAVFAYYHLRTGKDLRNTDALAAAASTSLPIMVIHGDDDVFVPMEMGKRIYEAAGSSDKELHIVEDATHCASEYLYPDEYFDYVREFAAKHLD